MDKECILPPKVYAHGAIGKSAEIAELFKQYGANNPYYYGFGDASAIYYIDKHNNIKYTTPDTDLYYIICNSDWVELKPKHPKKTRKYLVTVKEGSPSCDGCEFGLKCSDEQHSRCEIGRKITELLSLPELAWKTAQVEDVTDFKPLPTDSLLD